MRISLEEAVGPLREGKIGVIPTDTIYGIVASALDRGSVERVSRLRWRDAGKPYIVLIGDVKDLERFGIDSAGRERETENPRPLSDVDRGRSGFPDSLSEALGKFWPGKVSIILPCPGERWEYLHRKTGTIAFRLPDQPELRELLRKTGPLIAPSANPQGEPPARTIEAAEGYFGDAADFYVDGGTRDGAPSTLVGIDGGTITVIREGAVKIT